MKFDVTRCWGGNNNFYYRVQLNGTTLLSLRGEEWTREMSQHALNTLASVHGFKRRNIRFVHR